MGNAALLRGFLRQYVWRYAPVYAAGIGFLLATNWLTVWIPQLQKQVFDELAGGRRLAEVQWNAGLIAAAAVTVIVVRTLSRVLFFNPGRTIEYRVRNDMLDKLLQLSPAWYRRHSVGDIMSRASDDATYVRALVGFAVIMLLNSVVAVVLAVSQMLATDAMLTLTCAVPLIGSILIMRKGAAWAFAKMRDTQQAQGNLSGVVLESYKGIAAIVATASESAFVQRFDAANDHYTRLNLSASAVRTFVMPVVGVVGNVCVFLLLWIGGQRVVQGQLTVGDMAAYASYIAVLVAALSSFGWVIGVLQRGFVSLRRVWEVLDEAPDLPTGSQPLPAGGLALTVRGLTVHHGDAPDGPPALQDIHLTLAPGKVLGVFGPVGSGKSTLLSVLSRLLPPPRGSVQLGGVDLLDVAGPDLRQAVAVVPQEPFLFSRSVRDNVGFVDPPELVDDARVAKAVQEAQLAGEVARLQDGMQTVVGEKGLTLSGGQRQRMQLARALYRGWRLILLDDVLSAVDHETESRLLAVLREAIGREQASAVIVSHRLTALAHADEIVVLEEGRITARGSHASLVAAGGRYADVWAAQQATPDADADLDTAPALVAVA